MYTRDFPRVISARIDQTRMSAPAPATPIMLQLAPGRRKLFTGIYPDIFVYAALLLACGLAFYLHWEMWEDQSAQVYMTWGLFHGLRPYVGLIDPNWPGILLPHVLAYLLSGVDAWGLRAVDLVFLLALLVATSWILEQWKTPRSLRLLAGCAYLLNYFGTGWWWTAQRESFCWPLFVIGAIPFLSQLGPSAQSNTDNEPFIFGSIAWFIFGTVAGMSLWIKPVAWLALFLLMVTTPLLCDQKKRGEIIWRSGFFVAGIALISLMFVLAMGVTGTLNGFIKWGILYDLGPYSQVKWPWLTRLGMMFEFLVTPEFMPLPLVLALAGCVTVGLLKLSTDRRRRYQRPVLAASTILFAAVMTALLQGKTQSYYHFLPMIWASAFFAATIWSILPWKKAFADASMLLTAAAIAAMFIREPASAGPTFGEIAADRMRPELSSTDEVVLWGYQPSLLARLQRRTPFQTFIGTSFLITSPPDSWAYREVLDRLNTALQDPSVRYLFVDQMKCIPIQTALPYPISYLMQDPKLSATIAKEYRPHPETTLRGFDVLEHIPLRSSFTP